MLEAERRGLCTRKRGRLGGEANSLMYLGEEGEGRGRIDSATSMKAFGQKEKLVESRACIPKQEKL